MSINRPEFNTHDDFNYEYKKIGKVTREEFIKYIRSSHEHIRKLSQSIQKYDKTIESFEENEQDRELAESVRASNEEERISKDIELDRKLDSKANKSMFLSPKYDLVYDSCVRDVNAPLDAYSVSMESGHYFENVEDRNSDTILTYEPDGVLLASSASRFDFSPVLISDFEVDFPYFDVRVRNSTNPHNSRFWLIKYKDKDNWVAIGIQKDYQELTVITSVEGIQTDIAKENVGGSTGERQAYPNTIYSLKAEIIRVHRNFAESREALRVHKNEQWVFTVPIPTNSAEFPNKVGFSVGSETEILNFKAGRST